MTETVWRLPGNKTVSKYCRAFVGVNIVFIRLTLNIPSLARQRCLPSWGPRRSPLFYCNFSTV